MHPFRAAIEARDLTAAVALMAEDVEFRSPAVFSPYRGRGAVATILHAVMHVFEDFEYVREIGAPDAADHALVFRARVGSKQVEGADFLHASEDGLVDDFAVMVRPLSGLLALAEAMSAQLSGTGHSHDGSAHSHT
jgi:limonene-1,2-epoxide hydrolase